MCGIVGYVGNKNASDIILEGLKKLEYRGYDSAGIAVNIGDKLDIRRSVGKLCNLKELIKKEPLKATIGIGHTRWATHGKPCQENAHPHTDSKGNIVIVHNGIIENYVDLKNGLKIKKGDFKSETDTEVIAHLINHYYDGDLLKATQRALQDVKGSYALGVISKYDSSTLICARYDAPLIIGVGKNENFIASDIPALLSHTKNMIFLENGDSARITKDKIEIFDKNLKLVKREIKTVKWDAVMAEKDGYDHFMLKEIYEQPRTIEDTLRGRISPQENKVYIEEVKLKKEFVKKISKIYIVACGTSYHAGLVGKFLFENFSKIPSEVDIASEFRYRQPILDKNTLTVFISQSGETADTLAALRLAKSKNCKTLAICNVVGSSISREADSVVYTHCGPEIGVASTKAFTGQLTALYILSLDFATKKGSLSKDLLKTYISDLWQVPLKVSEFLKNSPSVYKIAKLFYKKRDFLYLGRHVNYPIALEGALKLKEISYIHAEGYGAGEMKHGPIALISQSMPIVAVAVSGIVFDKIISNIAEAEARGATIILITDKQDDDVKKISDYQIVIPKINEFISPLISVIPLQLLAYYVAVLLKCDVDRPRNLAKSVTVE